MVKIAIAKAAKKRDIDAEEAEREEENRENNAKETCDEETDRELKCQTRSVCQECCNDIVSSCWNEQTTICCECENEYRNILPRMLRDNADNGDSAPCCPWTVGWGDASSSGDRVSKPIYQSNEPSPLVRKLAKARFPKFKVNGPHGLKLEAFDAEMRRKLFGRTGTRYRPWDFPCPGPCGSMPR